jgi:hypothetical protein
MIHQAFFFFAAGFKASRMARPALGLLWRLPAHGYMPGGP